MDRFLLQLAGCQRGTWDSFLETSVITGGSQGGMSKWSALDEVLPVREIPPSRRGGRLGLQRLTTTDRRRTEGDPTYRSGRDFPLEPPCKEVDGVIEYP